MATTTENKIRFLDPEILSNITNLELLARTVVEGFITGLHKSPYKGFSVEFMAYREYMPGDDPARIDWKLYARSDRIYIKEFEDETNTKCHIMLDVSNSMAYTSSKVNKFQYGSFLAASLAYFMIKQKDSVGLNLFDNEIITKIPPKGGTAHLHLILNTIENVKLGQTTSLKKPLHELADSIKRRGFVVIISDLLSDPDDLISGLKHFRFDGHEVILFHVLDPFEVTYMFKDMVELVDMETGEKLLVSPETAKDIYMYNLTKFRDKIKEETGLLGVDYQPIVTNQPLDIALYNYLASRSRKK